MGREEDDEPAYLGARIEEEKRLVLVPLDPERPWTAFKRMRAWMKRSHSHPDRTSVDVFTAPEEPRSREVSLPRPADRPPD
jgi:hypothetical protein